MRWYESADRVAACTNTFDSFMKPFSCMSRMPSSFVAPQTPACVVTGRSSSRATSLAGRSGRAGTPVPSKASGPP